MKKNINIKLITLIIFIISFHLKIFANDSELGTNGGNVFPVKKSQIKMLSEKIEVWLQKEKAKVVCEFKLYNPDKPQKIKVGFPNYIEFNTTGDDYSKPLIDFKTYLNGKIIKVADEKELIKVANSTNPNLKNTNYWKTWEINFDKNETKLVKNTYTAEYGNDVFNNKFFSYILKTGANWNGAIKSGEIIIHFENISFNEIEPHFSSLNNSVLRWKLKNYIPNQDIFVSFKQGNFLCFDCSVKKLTSVKLKNKSAKELTLIRNEIYAKEGYVFKRKDLTQYFKKQKWYIPYCGGKFSCNINETEKANINFISKYQKKYKLQY